MSRWFSSWVETPEELDKKQDEELLRVQAAAHERTRKLATQAASNRLQTPRGRSQVEIARSKYMHLNPWEMLLMEVEGRGVPLNSHHMIPEDTFQGAPNVFYTNDIFTAKEPTS